MADRILFRKDTAANWTSNNPVLADGEIGIETDSKRMKLGDGSTTWSSLEYYWGTPSGNTASRPSSPYTGFMYYDTDLTKPIWYDGSTWRDAAATAV